jgi:hypothetical protein
MQKMQATQLFFYLSTSATPHSRFLSLPDCPAGAAPPEGVTGPGGPYSMSYGGVGSQQKPVTSLGECSLRWTRGSSL